MGCRSAVRGMVIYDGGPLIEVEAKVAALKYRLQDFVSQIVSRAADELVWANGTSRGLRKKHC